MWWANIRTPQGRFLWPLNEGDEPDNRLVMAARHLVGFPTHSDWIDESEWDIMLSQGDPHPNLLAQATVGTTAELKKVTKTKVDAYEAGMAETVKAAKRDAAKRALDALDDAARAEVLAEAAAIPPTPTEATRAVRR